MKFLFGSFVKIRVIDSIFRVNDCFVEKMFRSG